MQKSSVHVDNFAQNRTGQDEVESDDDDSVFDSYSERKNF